jgi:hypothetical protein
VVFGRPFAVVVNSSLDRLIKVTKVIKLQTTSFMANKLKPRALTINHLVFNKLFLDMVFLLSFISIILDPKVHCLRAIISFINSFSILFLFVSFLCFYRFRRLI